MTQVSALVQVATKPAQVQQFEPAAIIVSSHRLGKGLQVESFSADKDVIAYVTQELGMGTSLKDIKITYVHAAGGTIEKKISISLEEVQCPS